MEKKKGEKVREKERGGEDGRVGTEQKRADASELRWILVVREYGVGKVGGAVWGDNSWGRWGCLGGESGGRVGGGWGV